MVFRVDELNSNVEQTACFFWAPGAPFVASPRTNKIRCCGLSTAVAGPILLVCKF